MRFDSPLVKGTFISRYKRFFMDAALDDGSIVTAHSVNTGSMKGVLTPGNTVWMSESTNPARKLKYTWEIVHAEGTMIGINTSRTNALAVEAIKDGIIPELQGYDILRREVKYGTNSRIDILLETAAGKKCYVEVKNVHLKDGDLALFPDAKTERGVKHMAELAAQVQAGNRAVVLFIIQRDDLKAFAPARAIDPLYAQALETAVKMGVEALAYNCYVSENEIRVIHPMPVLLGDARKDIP